MSKYSTEFKLEVVNCNKNKYYKIPCNNMSNMIEFQM